MKPIVLLTLGIWLGMVIGISFVEAPLKFKAPNITLILGLGIGKLIFSALNKFELIFSATVLIWLLKEYASLPITSLVILVIPIGLVAIQSFWLFPILNARIDSLVNGIAIAKTNHHFYYVGFECMKTLFLLISFIKVYYYE